MTHNVQQNSLDPDTGHPDLARQVAVDQGNGCLYYDGQCPLCTREVARLREISDGLALCDIHEVHDATLPSRDTLLRELHFRDANGRFLVGLDANVAAWQYTRYGWLWRVLQWPVIRPLAERAYNAWATQRYRRLYGDSDTSPRGHDG